MSFGTELDFGQNLNGLAIVRGAKHGVHQFLYGHGQAETVRKIAVVSVYPANALSSALSKLAKVELRMPQGVLTAMQKSAEGAHPPDLQFWPLMEMDFANACPLVRPVLPRIRFLFVGSRLCSTLPSDGPSRFRPCASLVLHLHQVTQGTFTPKLSDMSDTQAGLRPPPAAADGLDTACHPAIVCH